MVAALLLHRPREASDPSSPGVRPWPLAFGFLAAGNLLAAAWHRPLVDQVKSLPIDARYADMLPLMLEGFKDLDAMRSPYRDHQLPWTLSNYYLPATFGPYYAAYRLGADIRWVTVVCVHGLSYGLLLLAFLRSRAAPLGHVAMFLLTWLVAANLVYWHVQSEYFVRVVHLGPYWLYVCLAFAFLSSQMPRAAAGCFLLMLGARESALALVLIPYLWAWTSGGKRRGLIVTLAAAAFAIAIFLPFAVRDPWFLGGNLRQYAGLGFAIESEPWRFVGFSGVFRQLGLPGLSWAALATGLGALSALYWKLESGSSMPRVLEYSLAMTTVFHVFAPVAWEYVYVDGLLVFAVLLMTPEQR